MRALLMMAALGVAGFGCSSSDPCDGLGTCLGVTVTSAAGPISFDQLNVTVSGQVNGTRLVPTMPRPSTLPQTVALEFNPPGGYMGQFGFDVTVVAENHGTAVANGKTHAIMSTGMHAMAAVALSAGAPGMAAMDLGPGSPGGPSDMAGQHD